MMTIAFYHHGSLYHADLNRPIDISMPLREGLGTVNCFYAPPFETAPVVAGSFIGSTRAGGPVNFLNIRLNPHGNGTHTECVGHIAKENYTIHQSLTVFHCIAKLGTVYPQRTENGDRVIFQEALAALIRPGEAEALVLRTMPNDDLKLRTNYSGSNPPYLHHEAAAYVADCGVKHLLLDLPSVDREEDGGLLLSHRAFWRYPEAARDDCTITELIYVPDAIRDGFYLLNLQIASFEIDVSPSKPVLYAISPGAS